MDGDRGGGGEGGGLIKCLHWSFFGGGVNICVCKTPCDEEQLVCEGDTPPPPPPLVSMAKLHDRDKGPNTHIKRERAHVFPLGLTSSEKLPKSKFSLRASR